jgi:putative oxidoreductase
MRLVIEDAAAGLGRLMIAVLFLHEAWSNVSAYARAAAYMRAFGVPEELLPFAIALELGCGLLILIGFQTRAAALLLAGFCIAAAVLFHNKFGDHNQLLHFGKDLTIAGGLLLLFAHGAGRCAVDALVDTRLVNASVAKQSRLCG